MYAECTVCIAYTCSSGLPPQCYWNILSCDLISCQAIATTTNDVDGNHGNKDKQQDGDDDEAQSDDSKCTSTQNFQL